MTNKVKLGIFLGLMVPFQVLAAGDPSVPTIDPNVVGTVHITDNPAVTSVAYLANWVLGGIGGIAIFLGLFNLVTAISKYMSGNKEAIVANKTGVFGTKLLAGNSIVVILLEFFLGVMLLGFAISGSWVQIVNALMVIGMNFFNGLGSAIKPK